MRSEQTKPTFHSNFWCISYKKKTPVTNSTEFNPPLKADGLSAGQEVVWIYKRLKVQCRSHKRPPLDPILSEMNNVYTNIKLRFRLF